MEVKDLVPVDYANQRVLLTVQLAEKYGCTSKKINDNFQRTKAQFIEGIHYFKLTGAALRSFRLQFEDFEAQNLYPDKNGVQISSRARSLYLWTEQGALLHCKMLNTDAAWKVFKDLSNFYFAHRDDNLDELKAQIAQLKQENQALKAARPNFKPQPMSPEQNIASLEKLLKSIIGDHVKFEYLGEVKDGKLQ